VDQRETYFQLFALKGDGSKRGPALEGDVVTNAKADQGATWFRLGGEHDDELRGGQPLGYHHRGRDR